MTGAASRLTAVFIGGPAGSGKSTLAAALAPVLHAAVLDIDVATGALSRVVLELIGAHDFSEPRFAGLTRAARYDTLVGLAEDNLLAGTPVVVAAPLTAEREPAAWSAVAERLAVHADLALVWMCLPEGALTDRLLARGAARDTLKTADPGAVRAGPADLRPPATCHLALDAARPTGELVQAVLAYLTAERHRR